MRDYNHIMDRVEREIEEIMGEKKWTPQHAKALEELLMCEKCVKEIEKYAHAKKRMAGLPAPSEEEDEEMMEKPWHFSRRNKYNRENYNRRYYNYEEDDDDDDDERENYNYSRGMRGRKNYRKMPMNYHYMPWPEEMEEWDYGYDMPPFRYSRRGRGQNQYNQYPYRENQYDQGNGSNQSYTHNEQGQQQSTGTENSTTHAATPPVTGVVRK